MVLATKPTYDMKKLILLLFIPFVSFGQSFEKKNALLLCSDFTLERSFSSNREAKKALKEILNSAEISQSFFMQECKQMKGAAARYYKGTRYIHYDPLWMNEYQENKWLNTFILAHEVGHHYLLHTDDQISINDYNKLSYEDKLLFLEKLRKDESKADEFAAIVVAKLGASLSEIENSGIKDIFYEGDETHQPHPNKESRINAIRVGFSKKDIELINNSENEEFYISSVKKYFNNDLDGSFDDFKKFKSKNLTEKEILDEYQSMVKNFNTTKYVGRCNAITKAKNQCKRSAKPGLSFCWQHNDGENKDILIGRCKGITKTKKQCKRRASENKEFCWQHLIN